jgi:hypothetical protein
MLGVIGFESQTLSITRTKEEDTRHSKAKREYK